LNATELYDAFADDYHLAYHDWAASVERQGEALDRLIQAELGPGPQRILDCTCGIGTQSIGLARRGHSVVGTDISARAIERAKVESGKAGVTATFGVADVRSLHDFTDESFDVVISGDNSLPHLLTEDDLRQGVAGMVARLRTGGLFLASIRDYDHILTVLPVTTQPTLSGPPGQRRITFQLWKWLPDGRTYRFELFVLAEGGPGSWTVRTFQGIYRAVKRSELTLMLRGAGAVRVEWRMPEETGFFQPLILARAGEAKQSSS
jgi:SAM-dependent methyltransferase